MSFFSSIGRKLNISKVPEALRRSAASAIDFLVHDDEGNVRRGLAGMIKTLLVSDSGEITAEHWTSLRVLADVFSPSQSVALLDSIQDAKPVAPDEAAALLKDLPPEEKKKVIYFLFSLVLQTRLPEARRDQVSELALKLGFSQPEIARMIDFVQSSLQEKAALRRSGVGVLIVIGLIVVFLLLATWLRPVAFGLIIAYLLLPLEKFFERRLLAKRGLGYRFFQLLHWLLAPLRYISGAIKRKLHRTDEESEANRKRDAYRRIITKAVWETVFTVVVVITLLVTFCSNSLFQQLRDTGKSFGSWIMQGNTAPGEKVKVSPFAPAVDYLDRTAEKFSRIPPVQEMIQKVSAVLSDPQQMRDAIELLLRKSGGAFSLTKGFLGITMGFLGDLLLTVFFSIFFLAKLAEFCHLDASTGKQGEYLVRMLYNGKWLPGAEKSALDEATRLTGGIFMRLRIWLRGYLTLIVLDTIVYTFFFGIIGVPYFPILGVIAGCSQLLPFIGPVVTLLTTLTVTLACGGSGTQIVLIVLLYLIYNTVLEQFIIYPAVVGDSLGLTTLETIIVVLVGAIVAGIPGMILAMPTASIAKYLVPQIYRCWDVRRNASEKEKLEFDR